MICAFRERFRFALSRSHPPWRVGTTTTSCGSRRVVEMRLDRYIFEGELVTRDTDDITVAERRAAANTLVRHLDSVGRPQVIDHEAGAGVDDGRVVPAHLRVVENDVVVVASPDPDGHRLQRIAPSCGVAKLCPVRPRRRIRT